MEQSVECKVEDVQATCGDHDVGGMSVITVESASLASVQSDNSSIDEVVDHDDMDDVDEVNADVEDEASSEKDLPVQKSPVLDIILHNTVEDESELSEKFSVSAVNGLEVTDEIRQCDSPSCKTSEPENIKENSVSTEDMPFIPIKGSSDKCDDDDDGMKVASGNNSTLNSGIVFLEV